MNIYNKIFANLLVLSFIHPPTQSFNGISLLDEPSRSALLNPLANVHNSNNLILANLSHYPILYQ